MIAYSELFGPKQATYEEKTRILNQRCVQGTTQKTFPIAVLLLGYHQKCMIVANSYTCEKVPPECERKAG